MNGWMDEWMDYSKIRRRSLSRFEWMGGWMNEWIYSKIRRWLLSGFEWMDRWTIPKSEDGI